MSDIRQPSGPAVAASPAPNTAAVWRLHAFDHGGNCYGFETTRSGDRARVVINGKAALELPRAVWSALLDAAALQRGGVANAGRADLRAHMGAGGCTGGSISTGNTWDDVEDEQLRTAYAAGASVAELAILHRRSRAAVSRRLERLGLASVAGSDALACASATASPGRRVDAM